MLFSMNTKQIQKMQSKKACFGTKEWSNNSGICKGCEHKEDCEKIQKQKR